MHLLPSSVIINTRVCTCARAHTHTHTFTHTHTHTLAGACARTHTHAQPVARVCTRAHTHRYHHRERHTHTYTSATWSQHGSLCRLEGACTNRHTPPERASPPEQACRLHESKVSVDVGIDFASRSCFGRLSFCRCCECASSHALLYPLFHAAVARHHLPPLGLVPSSGCKTSSTAAPCYQDLEFIFMTDRQASRSARAR